MKLPYQSFYPNYRGEFAIDSTIEQEAKEMIVKYEGTMKNGVMEGLGRAEYDNGEVCMYVNDSRAGAQNSFQLLRHALGTGTLCPVAK